MCLELAQDGEDTRGRKMAKTPAGMGGPQVIAQYHGAVRACRPNLSPAPASELAARPNSCHVVDSRAINRR